MLGLVNKHTQKHGTTTPTPRSAGSCAKVITRELSRESCQAQKVNSPHAEPGSAARKSRSAVDRIWHIKNSQGQNLAWAFRERPLIVSSCPVPSRRRSGLKTKQGHPAENIPGSACNENSRLLRVHSPSPFLPPSRPPSPSLEQAHINTHLKKSLLPLQKKQSPASLEAFTCPSYRSAAQQATQKSLDRLETKQGHPAE